MKFLYPLFLLLLISSCRTEGEERKVTTDLINIAPTSENSVDIENLPVLTFEQDVFDFGTVIEGKSVNHTYEFVNTGKSDLVITNVSTSCGCTTAKDWSKKPYQPGEKGTITITFESENRPGKINKSVDIVSNAYPAVKQLKIVGRVLGPQ